MTQHWSDIDNTSLLLVWGANPVENHPACAAHMNAARNGIKKARMIVIDPRLTRTARQIDPKHMNAETPSVLEPDLYIRIRPGTDIAFGNGILNWILNSSAARAYKTGTPFTNMLAYHNGTNATHLSAVRPFIPDENAVTAYTTTGDDWKNAYYAGDGATVHPFQTAGNTAALSGYPKYCDSRFLVDSTKMDYVRDTLVTVDGTATPVTRHYTSFPKINASVGDSGTVNDYLTSPTVWNLLKKHVAPYTTAVVADICGCNEADIAAVGQALLDHSRMSSSDFSAAKATPQVVGYRATTILYAMGQTQHTCGSQNIKNFAVIQTLLGNMGRPGGGINALRGIHNVQGSTDFGLLYDNIPGYSGNPSGTYNAYMDALFGNRMTNAVVKASVTVGTNGSAVKFTAKTAGIAGNSITVTLVGDASTFVVEAGNVITVHFAAGTTANAIVTAMSVSTLVTATVPGTGVDPVVEVGPVSLTGGKDADTDAKHLTVSNLGLQQRGFHNMTSEWFGNGTSPVTDMPALWNLWPKGNGVQHIQTFRNMVGAGRTIKASVVWGQNPCISEPNQSAVRAGLKNLDLLVVVDTFLNETAVCARKVNGVDGATSDGVTYFIPACSYVEEAGSVTNSGRWIQWRERATEPKGNSKSDLELMFRLAYALDQKGAFAHILSAWAALPVAGRIVPSVAGKAYNELFGKYTVADPYSFAAAAVWYPGNVTGGRFEKDLSGSTEVWHHDKNYPEIATVYGSEFVAENVYKELARPLNYRADGTYSAVTGGTMWIYSGSGTGSSSLDITGQAGYSTMALTLDANHIPDSNTNLMPAVGWTEPTGTGYTTARWQVHNRAKSRNNWVTGEGVATTQNANNYPRWGWAWLLNRRVFYNNGEVASDQADNFVSPGLVSCMFTINPADSHALLGDWSNAYRKYKTFADKPSVASGPHYVGAVTYAGRFPGHTEPYESPRDKVVGSSTNLVATWGVNRAGAAPLVPADTLIGTSADFPFVLTTIRCVEHFQGGPITRNNTWNVEAEPVPWVEINVDDALAADPPIKDGDWINVITARSNTKTDQQGLSPNAPAGWSRGFIARVGVGLQSNQRVGRGVVAIPWHWGEKGLATGSRANDLCIDAYDANSQIPEYKACLCKIAKW